MLISLSIMSKKILFTKAFTSYINLKEEVYYVFGSFHVKSQTQKIICTSCYSGTRSHRRLIFRIMCSYRTYTSILDREKKYETMNFFGQKLRGFRWNGPKSYDQNYISTIYLLKTGVWGL